MPAEAPRVRLVVLGGSRTAEALARQQAARGAAVTRFEPRGEAAPAIEGATTVFIDLASDEATLGALAALLEDGRSADAEIVANVRDAALRRILDGNLRALGRARRPRILGTASLAAAAAVAGLRPYDLAYWRGQDRMHAVVIGFSRLGRACFEELVLAGIAGDLERPRMTILDREPDEVRKLLAREMPEIAVSADIVVAEFDPLRFTAPDGPLVAAESGLPVTLFLVALDDTADAIATTAALSRTQDQDDRAVGAVAVVTEGQRSLFDLVRPAGRPRDLGRHWSVWGGVDGDPDILDLLTVRSDALAERVHLTYQQKHGGVAGSRNDWAALPETFRSSNRRAAAHLAAKLWTIGLREPGGSPDPSAVEPHVHASVILPCAARSQEDAVLRRLSRIEHERWCADRRLDGWRFGPVRDDGRRLHPNLIPFDDPRFTDADIEKDASQIRFLFGEVAHPAPDGAVTPLVLGVVAAAGPHPGIGVPAAVALALEEPWRPVVVLCAILDAAECRLVRALDAALAAAGRSWRLLVPEIGRDNRDLRVIPDAADAALLRELAERPTTRFAPIGGIVAAADLWADPSAPDPHAASILAYVTARAAAVVTSGTGTADTGSG